MIQADNFDMDFAEKALPGLRELKQCHISHLDTDLPSALDEIIEGLEIVVNDYESEESQEALDRLMEARYPGGIIEAFHNSEARIEFPVLERAYKDANARANAKVDLALQLFVENFRRLWC